MNKQLVKPLYCYECDCGTEHVLRECKGGREHYNCSWCGCKTSVNVVSTAKAV